MFRKAVKERREFNKELYRKIFEITKTPKKVLDLGCGLNPLYFPVKDVRYFASDIDEEALMRVNRHFRKNKIKGKVFYLDLNDFEDFDEIERVDITLIFKVLDGFNRDVIKEILGRIKTDYFVISFATRTIRGERMNFPKREWFEKLIKKYEYKKLRFYNEVFYVITL